MLPTTVRSHPDCLLHQPSLGHPESPQRLQAVLAAAQAVAGEQLILDLAAPLPPDDDVLGVLKWIHEPAYLDRVRAAADIAPTFVDTHDCVVSKGTYNAALAAAGLAVQASLDLVNERLHRCFVASRPPSHHAAADRARGYCFFNSVALAAELVFRALNEPVLIVDFDVHHGNGTQQLFYDRAEVGYLSVHQYPAFPGTGAGDEIGTGRGRGTTRNIPLAAGADDDMFCEALEHGLEQLGSALRPVALVVSAGFDGHHLDPVGEMQLTADGYQRLTTAIVQAANTWSGGRILSFLEGGFEPTALTPSITTHLTTLAEI